MLPIIRKLSRREISSVLCLAILCMTQTGCGGGPEGPALHAVTGTVSFDGVPVDTGRVLYRMKEGSGLAYSAEIKGGQYTLQSEAGAVSVEVTASRPIPGKFDTSNPDVEPRPIGEMYIPEEYNSKTTLTADVASGENTIPFDLKSK